MAKGPMSVILSYVSPIHAKYEGKHCVLKRPCLIWLEARYFMQVQVSFYSLLTWFNNNLLYLHAASQSYEGLDAPRKMSVPFPLTAGAAERADLVHLLGVFELRNV